MSSPYTFSSIVTYGNYTTFTPTGTWTTNTTYTGNWYRLGENMFINYKVALAGAPTATLLTIDMPSGFSMDTGKLLQSGQAARSVALNSLGINDNNGGFYFGQLQLSSPTQFLAMVLTNAGTSYVSRVQVSSTVPVTFASGDDITVQAVVPIVGWSA